MTIKLKIPPLVLVCIVMQTRTSAGFRVGNVSGGTQITSKSLELAVPRAAIGEQLNVINEIIANAASRVSPTNPNGINVIIRIIP